jgi:membrane associated rhomboid family serine protease
MFVLYNFGENVEVYFKYFFGELKGIFYYLLLYLGGILFSNIISYKRHSDNPAYTAVGASGAVSAVVFSFILIAPFQMLYLFMSIPIPALLFALLYLFYEHYMDKKGNTGIAHDAHFTGALFGLFFTILLEPYLVIELLNGIKYYLNIK